MTTCLTALRVHHHDAQRRPKASTALPAPPPAADRLTNPPTGAGQARTARDALTAEQRRDIHALTRQHQRGAVTDAEFAAQLAKIHETGQSVRRRDASPR
ncbi:hypothetical protein [Micromonospora sp. NPDC004551]|uniref:hypothetical protein n=1 Tax=Micromonospora sp. NPDC004551 TaxID=3154284 RepID=UPI0033AF5AC0